MGSWAPISLKFVKNLGSRITEATGEKRAKSFLFQSLSMNLHRGNGLYVMGTVAQHRKLEEIYNLEGEQKKSLQPFCRLEAIS